MRKAFRRAGVNGATGPGALMLVAVIGLALAGCQGSQAGKGATTSTPTATAPTATAAPGGVWTRVTSASPDASGAPATLRTQYDTFAGQTSKTSAPEFRLRRSDDFGKTWVNLTPPQIPGASYPASVSYITGMMSPLNPQVFVLTMQLTGITCPQSGGRAASSICQVQYVTADGGATWKSLALPTAGLLGFGPPIGLERSAFVAQATRLYSDVTQIQLASSGAMPPGRLVASDDGGVTWRLVDTALVARNTPVYAFTATPSGSTVFALVGVNDPTLSPGQLPPLALWRSDDAGASWTAAGALPASDQGAMVAASDANGQTTLYLVAGDSYNAPRLFASHDGGASWTECSEQSTEAPGLLGALPNGSILLDTANAVEEWDGSAHAPQAVAPPSGISLGALATLQPQPDGSLRVWLVGSDSLGAVVEYTTIRA